MSSKFAVNLDSLLESIVIFPFLVQRNAWRTPVSLSPEAGCIFIVV